MMKKYLIRIISIIGFLILFCVNILSFKTNIYAKEESISIDGNLYEFDEKDAYRYSSVTPKNSISGATLFGAFSISGDVKLTEETDDVASYEISEGTVIFAYDIAGSLIDAMETDWHLVEDKSSQVDSEKLDEKILGGAIVLQTSFDRQNWVTDIIKTDIAGENARFESNFYETKAVQQVNGCYYRVIVAYEVERRLADTKIGPITRKHYEYKKYSEIYEFYLIDSFQNSSEATLPNATPRKELGKRINTGKDNGFSGNEPITDKDPHFGWDIGTFYLNGYTQETTDNEVPVFLKTLGDQITLWFNLKEDIHCLHGNDNLEINEDENGYDQYFGVEKTNFRHGALIIQFTDYEERDMIR